jgi:hypothetical protein
MKQAFHGPEVDSCYVETVLYLSHSILCAEGRMAVDAGNGRLRSCIMRINIHKYIHIERRCIIDSRVEQTGA